MSDIRLVRAQGVTAPEGFRAAGIAAGIKASGPGRRGPFFPSIPPIRENVRHAPTFLLQFSENNYIM